MLHRPPSAEKKLPRTWTKSEAMNFNALPTAVKLRNSNQKARTDWGIRGAAGDEINMWLYRTSLSFTPSLLPIKTHTFTCAISQQNIYVYAQKPGPIKWQNRNKAREQMNPIVRRNSKYKETCATTHHYTNIQDTAVFVGKGQRVSPPNCSSVISRSWYETTRSYVHSLISYILIIIQIIMLPIHNIAFS